MCCIPLLSFSLYYNFHWEIWGLGMGARELPYMEVPRGTIIVHFHPLDCGLATFQKLPGYGLL